MRIAHINVIGSLSTGRIAANICQTAMTQGHRVLFCFARGHVLSDVPSLRIGHKMDTYLHASLARITDRCGFYSKKATKTLIKQLKKFQPEILHLHNLHGYYLHLPTLFAYIKESDVRVVWTLHDCWAYTGHCAYYTTADLHKSDQVGCDRWHSGCGQCPQKKEYPSSLLMDQSQRNWHEKCALFSGIRYMVLATPSEWLKNEVERSFLGQYAVYMMPNGLDTALFAPCRDERFMHDTILRYGLETTGGRHLVLSVAAVWDKRKGLEDLIDLAIALGDDYCVVAVGLDEDQCLSLANLPLIGLPRTGNINELCALYTASDVYVTTSYEETMGMTLVESLACGTQVICYDATAMPEIVTPDVGMVVPLGDITALCDAVETLCETPKIPADCIAHANLYESSERCMDYVHLYDAMIKTD